MSFILSHAIHSPLYYSFHLTKLMKIPSHPQLRGWSRESKASILGRRRSKESKASIPKLGRLKESKASILGGDQRSRKQAYLGSGQGSRKRAYLAEGGQRSRKRTAHQQTSNLITRTNASSILGGRSRESKASISPPPFPATPPFRPPRLAHRHFPASYFI
jgi:hypothetical protein